MQANYSDFSVGSYVTYIFILEFIATVLAH